MDYENVKNFERLSPRNKWLTLNNAAKYKELRDSHKAIMDSAGVTGMSVYAVIGDIAIFVDSECDYTYAINENGQWVNKHVIFDRVEELLIYALGDKYEAGSGFLGFVIRMLGEKYEIR